MLEELSVKIPLVEALDQMPRYAKFMNDLVTRKQTMSYKPASNLHHYIVVASRSIVEKKKNLGSSTIPCTIGSFNFA